MREILFRGKRYDDKNLILSDSIMQTSYGCVNLWHEGKWIEVIPRTVGQYTGLKDKNGTKIFEGDIVQTNKFFLSVGLNAKYVIEYDVKIACFIGTMQKGCVKHFTTFQNDSDQFEVIGNIHDNPELLNAEDSQ